MRRPISRARGENVIAPQCDCAIIPLNAKRRSRFDNWEQFVFETVFRLIAIRFTDSPGTVAEGKANLRRRNFDYGVRL